MSHHNQLREIEVLSSIEHYLQSLYGTCTQSIQWCLSFVNALVDVCAPHYGEGRCRGRWVREHEFYQSNTKLPRTNKSLS